MSTPRTAPTALHMHRTGSGEPLVLLHGLGESLVGWRPVIDALAADYDVIALDFPGFGGSAPLDDRVSPNAVNLAAAVERTLDGLGITSYHVAGYSLGARVAIELAKTDRVRSVIAISPDGMGTPLERVQGFIALVAGRSMAMTLAPVGEFLSLTPTGRSVFFAGSRSLPWQLTRTDAEQLLTGYADAPAYEKANWASMFDMPTHLGTMTQPTLLLQGTSDPLMAPQIMRYRACIRGAQLRWLPGANHVPISDAPRAVGDQMLDFLAAVTTAAESVAA
ncbi:MAG: alpha/beta hydrolase [Nakamurella sp.]